MNEVISISGKYDIEVVSKTLDIIALFDYRHRALSLEDVTSRLGFARSTTFRILQTLESKGFLVQDKTLKTYCLGPAALRIGLIARTYDRLEQELYAVLYELHNEFMETVNFGVIENSKVVYAEILESPHPFRMSARIGDTVPLDSTAIGKAILAEIDDPATLYHEDGTQYISDKLESIRRNGYFVDDEETEKGARCIGVALKDPSGVVFGGLSISGPAGRITDEVVSQIGARLVACSRRIHMASSTR